MLPVKQTNKLYNVRYNKTVLLEKAREYVHHLEATLKTLLQVCLLLIVKLWFLKEQNHNFLITIKCMTEI